MMEEMGNIIAWIMVYLIGSTLIGIIIGQYLKGLRKKFYLKEKKIDPEIQKVINENYMEFL